MTATVERSAARAEASVRRSTPAAPKRRRDLGDLALMLWSIAVIGFLFVPIIVIVVYSFNTGRLLVAFESFGFESFLVLLQRPVIQSAVIVSIQSGLIAAVIATTLGTLAGIAMARRPGRWVLWFGGLLLLVSVTPEIVDAVSLLPWLVTLGQDVGLTIFNNGIARLVVGHTLFATAVVSYIVRARLIGLDANLEEASADLYATPWKTFLKVTLPLAMPAVLAGFLLAFTLSLDNTIISAFVQVSGATPWPVYVLSSVRSGLRPEIAAVSTVMLLLTLVALALVAVVLRRAGDSATQIARTMTGS